MILRFDYIPYPLWRRRMPAPLRRVAHALLRPFYPIDWEQVPPVDAAAAAAYLARWQLLPRGITTDEAKEWIEESAERTTQVAAAITIPAPSASSPSTVAAPATPPAPVRLPAQWEAMERILLAFPVLYPPLWAVHAQMIAAIHAVAEVTVLLPARAWAGIVSSYLRIHGMLDQCRVEWLTLPTDDIWIRDYGPFVGHDTEGNRAVVDAVFTPLGNYPQMRDNAAASAWAAHAGIPLRVFDFSTEGGNFWSDGVGTLLVSDEMLVRYPQMNRREVEDKLHEAFSFDKLIVLPRLLMEETGHVDLVCKLVDKKTVLVNAPNGSLNDDRLRTAAALLRRETNAQGDHYRVVALPLPPMYRNWGLYPVWRSYTNSLTVNGRVLVPIFGTGSDAHALEIYRQVMPEHEVIAIDCRASANGGGAVHCLTKEVPKV